MFVILRHEIVPSTHTTSTPFPIDIIIKLEVIIILTSKKTAFSNFFYIRAMSQWDLLPDECRKTEDDSIFKFNKTKVLSYLWSLVKNRLTHADL